MIENKSIPGLEEVLHDDTPVSLPEGDQASPQLDASPSGESEPQQTHVEQPQAESPQAMRFKTLRQLKEKAERERDEAVALLQRQSVPQQEQEQRDPEFNLEPDAIAEGKHISQVNKEIKALRKELSEYKQKASLMTDEARLKIKYPDIDSIVSKENMEILAVQEPEVFATIQSSQDFYNKAATAYTMIKKLGITSEDYISSKSRDPYQNDKEIVSRNISKPKPTNSISPQRGESPLTQANAFANGLTEDLKKKLYQEMLDARRNF